jgi:hypothetical protein
MCYKIIHTVQFDFTLNGFEPMLFRDFSPREEVVVAFDGDEHVEK